LQRAEHALASAAGLRRICRDVLDPEMGQRTADLGQLLLVDRLAGLRGEEVMSATVGIEARWQAAGCEHLEEGPQRRNRAFLLDQKCRVDLAGRVVHGDNEIERGRPFNPGKGARVLVQHHAQARLALTLAPVGAAPLGAIDEARRLQLPPGPGVAPLEPILPPQIFVEMLHVPTRVAGPVLAEHPDDLVDRHPSHRRLAEPTVGKPGKPVLLIAPPIPAELPFRASNKLACLHRR
jgi:hypothetical protein